MPVACYNMSPSSLLPDKEKKLISYKEIKKRMQTSTIAGILKGTKKGC